MPFMWEKQVVGNTDLVSGTDWRKWKWECRICLTLVSLRWNWVIRAGGLGDAVLGLVLEVW